MRLNSALLNNQEITEEIKGEIKKYLETNDNGDTTTQNLLDAAKAVLRGKFIAIQAYLKKQETSRINNLTLHLKQLEKEEQKNPKASRRKEIIKIRSEINEKEMKEKALKMVPLCPAVYKSNVLTNLDDAKKNLLVEKQHVRNR